MPDKALTAGTISLVATIIVGWLWVDSYFMSRAEANTAHAGFKADIRETYLELKIDGANSELAFIERGGVAEEERRRYDLLKFGVERMSQSLMDLEK